MRVSAPRAAVIVAALSLIATECLADKQALSLEDIYEQEALWSRTVENVQWSPDGTFFNFTQENPETGLRDIYVHEVASGAERPVIAGDALRVEGAPIDLSGYEWTADRRFVLLAGPVTLTWDSQREGPYYIYEVETGDLRPLGDNRALRNVHLSPDGSHVGYVLENDLYIASVDGGAARAITTDGSANIFNGIRAQTGNKFGYEEPWSWSPDGKKIAFMRQDATDVKLFYLVDAMGKYNEIHALKYANAGEHHAVYGIGVFDLESGQTAWMDIGTDTDSYVPDFEWAGASDVLAIQRLTRDQDTLELLLGNADTGETRTVVTDTDGTWVNTTDDLMFLEDGRERFVWTSEKSGWRHAYLYDFDGNERPLTQGDWEVTSLIAVDEQEGWLYFYAKKDSIIDQHVYRVRLDASGLEKVSGKPGWYEWSFSPDDRHVIQAYSDAATPPVTTLLESSSGESLRVLDDSVSAVAARFAIPNPEFFQFETGDGIELNASFIKPLDFDPEKKYPVIVYGYGNVGTQVVVNRWGARSGWRRDLWHRYMAEQGFIIFRMDNRTTAGRGKAAKDLTYGEYGKYAVLDQLEGAKYLSSLSYVDDSRIGVWGWSGGGYLACALMTKGAPIYKTGVCVAPVIDLLRYEAVGVERWMGSPDENEEGYGRVNLMNYADRLQGSLLLIHGTGDDNVKFAFTLQFANALIEHGKQFDMLVYPNRHHGIHDAKLHVYTRMTNWFLDEL